MKQYLKIPHWSYEDIRHRADEFLARFHATGSIPVPIEDIIDQVLRVDIVALPNLLSVLDVDAFTSSDMRTICIDEFIYTKRPNRYRFSLAHEAGHIWMHKEVYTSGVFDRIDQWREFVDSIPEESYSWLEWQAYCFAGLVLVPSEHLTALIIPELATIEEKGISLEESADFAWDYVAAYLAKKFEVSTEVVRRRIDYDGLKKT